MKAVGYLSKKEREQKKIELAEADIDFEMERTEESAVQERLQETDTECEQLRQIAWNSMEENKLRKEKLKESVNSAPGEEPSKQCTAGFDEDMVSLFDEEELY